MGRTSRGAPETVPKPRWMWRSRDANRPIRNCDLSRACFSKSPTSPRVSPRVFTSWQSLYSESSAPLSSAGSLRRAAATGVASAARPAELLLASSASPPRFVPAVDSVEAAGLPVEDSLAESLRELDSWLAPGWLAPEADPPRTSLAESRRDSADALASERAAAGADPLGPATRGLRHRPRALHALGRLEPRPQQLPRRPGSSPETLGPAPPGRACPCLPCLCPWSLGGSDARPVRAVDLLGPIGCSRPLPGLLDRDLLPEGERLRRPRRFAPFVKTPSVGALRLARLAERRVGLGAHSSGRAGRGCRSPPSR